MTALNAVARPYIQDSITRGKAALDAGIESLPDQRPFLANTEGLMRELQPGMEAAIRQSGLRVLGWKYVSTLPEGRVHARLPLWQCRSGDVSTHTALGHRRRLAGDGAPGG